MRSRERRQEAEREREMKKRRKREREKQEYREHAVSLLEAHVSPTHHILLAAIKVLILL